MIRRFFVTAFVSFFAVATTLADDAPKQMKLFLLIGQSNMAGRGKVEEQDKVVNPHIFMLTKDLKWVAAKDPLHFDKSAAGVGPGSQFAREVSKAQPEANIGLIPCAVGGTSLDQWQAGGALYKTAVERAKEAMKQGTLAGILWHQGESDNAPDKAATYAARLRDLIGQFRKDLNAEKVPVVLGELIYGHGNNDAVNVEIRKASKKIPLCGLASSEGLGKKQLHYESADARTLGQHFAAEYLKLAKP